MNTTSISDLQARINALLAENRLADARDTCIQLRELLPEDAGVLHMLARLERQLGNTDMAIAHCHNVLSMQPESPQVNLELGAALQQSGKLPESIHFYQEAIRINPQLTDAHYHLANALRETGRFEDAASAYRRVLDLQPQHFACLNNLGILLTNLGKHKPALAYLQQANELQPNNVQTLVNLGETLTRLGRYAEAIDLLRHALLIRPDYPSGHNVLANALHHAGQLQEALTIYSKQAELEPDSSDAILGQARILEQMGRHDESYALLKPLLEQGCKAAIPQFFDLSKHLGKREEAVELLEDMLRSSRIPGSTAAAINFRLGRHYDETQDYDRAFGHFKQANALTPRHFDHRRLTRFVDDSIAVYSPDFVKSMPYASNHSKLPVFIVGMPRSGTSLVEQILAAHPDVFGAGELEHISRIVQQLADRFPAHPLPLFFRSIDHGMLNKAAESHLADLRTLGHNAGRVTDKMPGNMRYIGLIAQLFPAAPIIHCVRHPLDTCLSCFFANFGNVGHDYIYDLQTIGEYYIEYHRLMRHWEEILGDRIIQASYAQLVTDQETVIRELLATCELAWDDNCLDFHNSDRMVFTLSYDQVRQPLHGRSLGRWRHYIKHLQSLRDLLEAADIDCS